MSDSIDTPQTAPDAVLWEALEQMTAFFGTLYRSGGSPKKQAEFERLIQQARAGLGQEPS